MASLLFIFTDEKYGNEGSHGGSEINKIDNPELIIPSFKEQLLDNYSSIKAHDCNHFREYGAVLITMALILAEKSILNLIAYTRKTEKVMYWRRVPQPSVCTKLYGSIAI